MAENTNISWCDATWSPWYGCTQVSMGPQGACVACYARQMSETRFGRVVFGGPGRGEGTRDVRADSAWKLPLKWEREAAAIRRAWFAPEGPPDGGLGGSGPRPTFVFPSMCDPFDNHPDLRAPRRRFFDLIRATPNLTWLPLTKRPGNIVKLFLEAHPDIAPNGYYADAWPRNAAIGCTVVSQEEADRDIPKLLAAKAALNPPFAFLSMEPLLGPVDLTRLDLGVKETAAYGPRRVYWDALTGWEHQTAPDRTLAAGEYSRTSISGPDRRVDWVITGGETDQGKHRARETPPDWFRSIRDQCLAAGVTYHHKQMTRGGPIPADLQIQERPHAYA